MPTMPDNYQRNAARLRLLVVEDQVDFAENLFDYLGEEHYSLDYAADGLSALHLLATHSYDVIVLDLMLPGINGFDICRRIRTDLNCNTPIILMTALGSLGDKEQGFQAGADDYLVKPFELRELQLRIEALHRRQTPNESILQAGDFRFNPGTLRVEFRGKQAELSGTSATLLELLIRAYPSFLSHQRLSEALWGDDYSESDGNLRTHIYTLRKLLQQKLGDGMIKTMHGRGYRLEPPGPQQ